MNNDLTIDDVLVLTDRETHQGEFFLHVYHRRRTKDYLVIKYYKNTPVSRTVHKKVPSDLHKVTEGRIRPARGVDGLTDQLSFHQIRVIGSGSILLNES